MPGKWKAELSRVKGATKDNAARAKRHAKWHADLSIAASNLQKAATSQGNTSKRAYNQLLIQQKACIGALEQLAVLEAEAEKAKKAKDKKKSAEIAAKMKAYQKTYSTTKKAYNTATTETINCSAAIDAAVAAVAAVKSP